MTFNSIINIHRLSFLEVILIAIKQSHLDGIMSEERHKSHWILGIFEYRFPQHKYGTNDKSENKDWM